MSQEKATGSNLKRHNAPMSKFVRSLAELVSAEHAEEHLGNRALHVKPSNVEGGFGLKSKDQLLSMLEVCVCCGIIPKQK